MDTSKRARRLKLARRQAGYATAAEAAREFGWNVNTYSSNENGNAPFSFRKAEAYAGAFGVTALWLYAGDEKDQPAPTFGPAVPQQVPVVGTVDETGVVAALDSTDPAMFAPQLPGGGPATVALVVSGQGLGGLADPGSLLYFDDARRPAGEEALDQIVVAEASDQVLMVARLRPATSAHRYELNPLDGSPPRTVRLKWASPVTALLTPVQARRLLEVLSV